MTINDLSRQAAPVVRRDHDSPLGRLQLFASAAGLRAVLLPQERPDRVSLPDVAPSGPDAALAEAHLGCAGSELDEYFEGRRTEFTVTLAPVGTDFQRRAWEALRTIPYGQTYSYGDQARSMGQPTAVRAVGSANGKNPLSIIVPCHRVVGANGSLTGYAGGVDAKRFLLDLESRSAPGHRGSASPDATAVGRSNR